MRARSLLLGSLLLLGAGSWVWFVLRTTRAHLPIPPAASAPAPQTAPAAAALDSPAEASTDLPADGRPATRSALAVAPAPAAQRKDAVTLRGFVLGDDDAPVQVFDLELVRTGFSSSEEAGRHVESPDGSFTVEPLTPGFWKIAAHARGMVMTEAKFSIQLPHEPVLLRMRRTACVSGIVLDDGGSPVEYADVRAVLVRAGASEERTSVQSDPDGQFRFEDLEPGEWAFVACPQHHEAPSEPVRRTLALGDVFERVMLRLKSGGTILGDVSAECVASFQGGEVNLANGLGLEQHRDVALGEDGRFRFDHVTPGRWWIVVMRPSEAKGPGPSMLTTDCIVSDGQTIQVHLGASTPDSVRVHGRVLRRGSPVPGIEVAAFLDGVSALRSARIVRTDAEGYYELVLGACGQATFLVAMETDLNGTATHVRIPCVREHKLDLACISSSAELHGRVVDAGGAPVRSRQVRAMAIDDSQPLSEKHAWQNGDSDESGAFAITNLRPGTYLVIAGGSGRDAFARQVVRLAEGEVAEGLELRLVAAGSVHGVVLTPDGAPCVGLEIFVRQASGELLTPTSWCASGPGGTFGCAGLAPGRYTFFARRLAQEQTGNGPLATAESTPVDVLAAQIETDAPSASIRLLAVPGTYVRVELSDSEGFSKPALVRVLDEAGRDAGCATGESDSTDALEHGAFGHRSRFGPLPPGRYTMEARTEGDHLARQEFRLGGEPEKQLSLRVE